MNQLSQLLYFGGVVHNIGTLLIFLGVFQAALAVAFWCLYSAKYEDGKNVWRYKDGEEQIACRKRLQPSLWPPVLLTPLCIIWFTAAALCPSQETVYAIAASQMGEQVIKSPIGGKAEKALEAWLDKQIADNTTPPAKKAE